MAGPSPSWFFGIRHALVALALLATLVSTFGFHVHGGGTQVQRDHRVVIAGECTGDHDCSSTSWLNLLAVADTPDLADTDSPECCHGASSVTDLPATAILLISADHLVGLLTPRDEVLRVGVTYQPDPPPVLG